MRTLKYVDSLLVVIEAIQNYLENEGSIPVPTSSEGLCSNNLTSSWKGGQALMDYILKVRIRINSSSSLSQLSANHLGNDLDG